MNIQGLTFTQKSRKAGGATNGSIDVSLTIQDDRKGDRKKVSCSFSKDMFLIMNKPEALVAAYVPGKIYFMQSSITKGFKVYLAPNYHRAVYKFPRNQLQIPESAIGYYDLHWDANRELFYINLMDKKNGI